MQFCCRKKSLNDMEIMRYDIEDFYDPSSITNKKVGGKMTRKTSSKSCNSRSTRSKNSSRKSSTSNSRKSSNSRK